MEVYKDYKVYGPYRRKDGRQHMVIKDGNSKKTTVSYPKYLTEKRLGRYLTEDETIDHIDNDFNNNSPENIRILSRKRHGEEDAIRLKPMLFLCPECGIKFYEEGKRLHDIISNRRRGKAGPFCSRSCAGIYGKKVQMGEDLLDVIKIDPEYTTLKNEKIKST